MKKVTHTRLTIIMLLFLCSKAEVWANGCTGSWFNVEYSPWCDCYQVCGNYISDCDRIVSLTWNFGDGTTYNGGSPCHRYSQPGTYTITMTVRAYCHNSFFNLFTQTCHITKQVTVTTTHSQLAANFTADTVCLGQPMHFTNTSVAPSGTNSYLWIFGDGTTSTATNPLHVFDSCGVYDVKLIVTNNTPCCAIPGRDTIVKRVFVNCPPNTRANYAGRSDPYIQESNATLNIVSGTCAGSTTQFNLVINGPINFWQFNFPDGSTSNSLTPSFVYTDCPPAVSYTTVDLRTNRGCPGVIDSITGIFCPSNISFATTTPLCTGQCSGTATVVLGGGTPPYSVVWNDPNSQTTFTATGLCPGQYNVTVTDGNGCQATPSQPAIVNDFPYPFTGTTTIQGAVLCHGWYGGSAVLNMTGGTPPYTYFWSDGQTTAAVTDLPGGINTVTATDSRGCTFVTTVNIPQPPPIQATFTITNATCGLCNGSATVNPTGGHGTYTYRWLTSPVRNTQTVTGLCAGIYLVVVEDATVWGCNDTFTVAISENGAQPITANATDATCFNICNGTATVTLTGGCLDPPCTYTWFDSLNNPIGQSTATANNLCKGLYTVRVTNGSGCRSFAQVTVNVPNPISASITTTPNTCGSTCNGTATVTAIGGAAPYNYQWLDALNNPIGQAGALATGLCPGTYTVRVNDQQGCIITASANVFNNPMIASASSTDVLCHGNCSGMITATVINGIMPYTFILHDTGGNQVFSGNSSVIANLCAGNYTLTVVDASQCNSVLPVIINQPGPLQATPITIQPLCYGNCNGTVSVSVNGGTPLYTYEWRTSNGTSLGSNVSVTNVCAGNYVVRITDANGCMTPFVPVPLSQPAPLTDSMAIIDPYCNNGQGVIDLIIQGGTAPYTYLWNTGATSQDLNNVLPGNYSVTITDANGCTRTNMATVANLPPLTATIEATLYNGYHFKCAGGSDGEVVVRVSGGVPPYTFQWNDPNNSTTDSIYGLTAGTYTVTVLDAYRCVFIDSITLDLMPPEFFLDLTHTDVTCHGGNDGSVSLFPSGGVPPYIFYWHHDTTSINIPLTAVPVGQYIVYMFDANFCLKVDSVQINEPPALQVNYTTTPVSCYQASDGAIDITPSGGIPPYIFSWNDGLYHTEDISGLSAGSYVIIISDSNQCTYIDTISVAAPNPLQTSISVTPVTCFRGNNGHIHLTVTGGTPPYYFNWNNGTYRTEDLQDVPAGNYVVVVSDNNGCTTTDTTSIAEPTLITGNRQVMICMGDSFFTGGNYQTLPGTYLDTLIASNGCDSILTTHLITVDYFETVLKDTICHGQHVLFGSRLYTTSGIYSDSMLSAGGCDSIVTLMLTVLPDIGAYALPESATLLYQDSITVSILTTNSSSQIISYTWSPATGISCNDCSTATIIASEDIRYTVLVVDSFGCTDTVQIPILVKGGVIYVPNAFSPNGDGTNDIFKVYGSGFKTFLLRIFNRWGEKIFETTNPDEGWDGTYMGKEMNPGVYVYYIDIEFASGKVPPQYYMYRKGSVTLIR